MNMNIVNGYIYKKLIPSGNGICTEAIIDEIDSSTDLSSKLFAYISGRKLHIFCIYIKNAADLKNHPAYEYAENLLCENPDIEETLHEAIKKKTNTIPRTKNFPHFKDFLVYSMSGCNLPFDLCDAFKASLSKPYNRETSLFHPYIDAPDVPRTLICFITRDTYEALKSCYSLPHGCSSVVQLSPATMVENDVYKQLTHKEETKINNQNEYYLRYIRVLDKHHISYSTEDETQSALKSCLDSFSQSQELRENLLDGFEAYVEKNTPQQIKKINKETDPSNENTI